MATIKPAAHFDSEAAAKELKNAMDGLGTNEAAIIQVLVKHDLKQRLEIAETYHTMYGQTLSDKLQSELSGDFEYAVLAMLTKPQVYDARTLYAATKGVGTDETTLIEIMCSRSNEEIQLIKKAYKDEYGSELEENLQGDCSGHFKRLMASQCGAHRATHQEPDSEKAVADAHAIFKAGQDQWGTDEAEIQSILCLHSYPQLRATFYVYKEIAGKDIEDAIKSETSGSLQAGFLAIIQYAKNPAAFFASRLYKAMKGLGTDEDTVSRVIITRSEVDLKTISEIFEEEYGESLAEFVGLNISGDYKRLLLTILHGAN